jgi:hypothetical protein
MQKLIGSEVLEKNLFQAQLAPAALIHFMPEHEDARLSSQAWERVEELAPHRTLTEWVENAPAAAVPILEPSALIDDDRSAPRAMTAATAGTINSSYNAANGRSGVPKWFKMPLAKK